MTFSPHVIPLNKCAYKNVILLVTYIENISIVYYTKWNLSIPINLIRIEIINFNQNQNFIKLLCIVYTHKPNKKIGHTGMERTKFLTSKGTYLHYITTSVACKFSNMGHLGIFQFIQCSNKDVHYYNLDRYISDIKTHLYCPVHPT